MSTDRRTLRGLASLALLVVLVLVATRFGGSDGGTGAGSGAGSEGATATDPSPTSSAAPASAPDLDPGSGLPYVEVADLPDEARDVLAAIDDGGPFDHPSKDGSTFGNYEGVLPDEPRGYYREYTVDTPGSSDRGARRIVTGGEGPEAFYWTADHYDTFSRVRR